jgi:GntR family transcriptional repressor for pyruvate dehydrogenase complex
VLGVTDQLLADADDADQPDHAFAFEPLSRTTISAQIRDRLLARIRSGALEPGARMPSERALSEQFQVARTSVREAMQGLLSLGLIERRGNRVYVAEHLPDVSFDLLDDRKEFVRQLFETRRLLELPIIELAAQRASERERAHISAIADGFRPDMALPEFRELDRAFHTAIAQACRNPLLVEVYGKVLGRLFRSDDLESLLGDEANRDEVGRVVADASRQHAALAQAVADGDAARAVAEGVDHLAAVERGLIDRMV